MAGSDIMRTDVRYRRRSKLLATALVVAVPALVLVVMLVARWRVDSGARPSAWGNVQVIGRDIQVEVNTSCGARVVRRTVGYRASTVVLTVFVVAGAKGEKCPRDTAKQLIHLAEPVGDRTLVDGACGDRPKPSLPNYIGC
jgi:hypothetical protein